MAAEMELPGRIVTHAHWLSEGVKMSKSIGNVVALIERYGVDAVRYFLLRDGSQTDDSESRYKSDLSNKLGNLLTRCASVSLNPSRTIPSTPGTPTLFDPDLIMQINAFTSTSITTSITSVASFAHNMDTFHYPQALEQCTALLSLTNQYLQSTKPWLLSKSGAQEELQSVLYYCFEVLRIVGCAMSVVIPCSMDTMLRFMDVEVEGRRWDRCGLGGMKGRGDRVFVGDVPILFPRLK